MTTQPVLLESKHFRLLNVAEGVFAALAKPEGMAACNAGIIDLGDRTLVIDTFLSPQAARDLRSAAERLTGRPVDLVLITHHHFDHIWGSQAFAEQTSLLSSAETRNVILATGEESLKLNRQNAEKMLQENEARLKEEQDETRRMEIRNALDQIRQRLDLIATIRMRLPNLTCQGAVTFYGKWRTAEFIPYEKAHSPGNAIIHLPQDDVVFIGDLLFARRHPFMGDGDPSGWLRVLEKVEALHPKLVVPGHGELSTLEEIKLLKEYIQVVTQKVQAFVSASKAPDALHEIELPEPFASWQPQDLLARTLNALYQFYSSER